MENDKIPVFNRLREYSRFTEKDGVTLVDIMHIFVSMTSGLASALEGSVNTTTSMDHPDMLRPDTAFEGKKNQPETYKGRKSKAQLYSLHVLAAKASSC